jgi:YbbR domain-containing protein
MIMALREIITRDWLWKLLSLALAVAIWLMVNPLSQGPAKATVNSLTGAETGSFTNLPVSVLMSSATDVREVKVEPDTVTVTVNGPPEMISAMTGQEILVILNLTGIEAARGLRKRVEVTVPAGVAFMSVEPSQVNVTVQPKPDRNQP